MSFVLVTTKSAAPSQSWGTNENVPSRLALESPHDGNRLYDAEPFVGAVTVMRGAGVGAARLELDREHVARLHRGERHQVIEADALVEHRGDRAAGARPMPTRCPMHRS